MGAGKLEKHIFCPGIPWRGEDTGGWLETSQLWLGSAVLRLPVSILPGQLSAACIRKGELGAPCDALGG